MVWAHETGESHHVRNRHKHRRISALPDAYGKHRRIPLQSANRDGVLAGGFAARIYDLYSAAWILLAAAQRKTRAFRRRTASAWIYRRLHQRGNMGHRAPLEGFRRISRVFGPR